MDPKFHLGSRSMEKKASLVLLGTQMPSEQVDSSTSDKSFFTKQAGNHTPASMDSTFEVRARSMEKTIR